MTTNKLPREMLRDLIGRSGISQTKIANALGMAHASSLNRYLRKETQADRPIPVNIVKRLVPLLRGTGHPPITTEEIMALTTLPLQNGTRADSSPGHLELRYRVEEGTFHKLSDVKGIGVASICNAADYPPGSQFAVVMGKEQLHCVDKAQFSPQSLMGRRALIAVPYGTTGLYEIKIGRIGEKMQGQVLGIVIGSYTRE